MFLNVSPCMGMFGLLVFFLATTICAGSGGPVVVVKGAEIEGKKALRADGQLIALEFLGIRFANRPERFARAVLSEPKSGEKISATKLPNSCVQSPFEAFNGGHFQGEKMWNPNTKQSEDCLFLNIWKSAQQSEEPNGLKPVLVWIYGGGFIAGTSTLNLYNGALLANYRNTIVVSMNYRLNVFGFLFFNNTDVPGNMGLWDQLLALQWVKNNIEAFGGDPNKITIFGESAGAASVNMHLLSSHSQSYFKNAIMQSASALAPWATRSQAVMLKRSRDFAGYMGCTGSDEAMIACLRRKDNMTVILTNQAKDWFGSGQNQWDFNDFGWVPVIDGDFLKDTPENLLKPGKRFDKNVMVGVNRDEGIYFVVYADTALFDSTKLYTRKEKSFINSATFENFFISLLPSHYKNNKDLAKSIFQFYQNEMNAPDSEANILTPSGQPQYPNKMQYALDRMVGDLHFVCPVNEFADKYSELTSGSVYYYYFNHRSSVQTWPEWMGVLHGYEINFIFGEPWRDQSELEQIYPKVRYEDGVEASRTYGGIEHALTNQMREAWSNIAKTGSPALPEQWEPYTKARRTFKEFSQLHFGRKGVILLIFIYISLRWDVAFW